MDVPEIEKVVEGIGGLQRQKSHIVGMLGHSHQFFSIGPIAANYEINIAPRSKEAADLNECVQTLIQAHISSIQGNYGISRNTEFLTSRTGSWQRMNGNGVTPVGEAGGSRGRHRLGAKLHQPAIRVQ